MRTIVSSFIAGLLFGIGLAIAQMISPAKVLAFLDIAGDWDPSLALVMGSAVLVAALGHVVARKRRAPMLAAEFHWPALNAVDARALGGGAMFGIGWGMAGYCPGPAIASIAFLHPGTLVFVAAMLAGMLIYEVLLQRMSARAG